LIPAAVRASAIPSAKGSSGPTTTKSILLLRHQSTMVYRLPGRKKFLSQSICENIERSVNAAQTSIDRLGVNNT
jgi:hypothetical protein